MPYSLIKIPSGYKVKSEGGTVLSKKPLSKKKAMAQKIAATLSSIKRGDIR